jgi:AcrR family transcriptional regulator
MERVLSLEGEPQARERLLDAGAGLVGERGISGLTMYDVAKRAGVSKGLIHYHFHDRARLLCEILVRSNDRAIGTQRAVLDSLAEIDPLQALWENIQEVISARDLRVSLLLSGEQEAGVQVAADSCEVARRVVATETMAELVDVLQVRPTVPVELLGELYCTFLAGLAIGSRSSGQNVNRAEFDVFCLALLRLTE